MSCDTSCGHSHMPLHCSRNKRNKKKEKRKIKSKKINKNKILRFKHTITYDDRGQIVVVVQPM